MTDKPTVHELEKLLHEDDAEVFIDSDGSVSTTNYKEKFEYWHSMAERAFVGGWAKAHHTDNSADMPVRAVQEFYQEWLQDVMENYS